MQAVASHISLKEREWQMLGSPLEKFACKEFILESSEHWYNYSLKMLRGLPPGQSVIIKCEDLAANAEKTIRQIYEQFGFTVSPDFQDILEKETVRARNHESEHRYSLEGMSLSQSQLQDRFGDIMQDYGYQIEFTTG
jgi:hypothetical protein